MDRPHVCETKGLLEVKQCPQSQASRRQAISWAPVVFLSSSVRTRTTVGTCGRVLAPATNLQPSVRKAPVKPWLSLGAAIEESRLHELVAQDDDAGSHSPAKPVSLDLPGHHPSLAHHIAQVLLSRLHRSLKPLLLHLEQPDGLLEASIDN
jgi:hypothetical protein